MLPDLKIGELNGRNGVLLRGPVLEDRFGHSVSVGDFNGDGFADVIVGKSGAAYVFYGGAAGLLSEIDLGQDSTAADVTLTGGTSVAVLGNVESRFIGDVNADGYDDILLSGFDRVTGSFTTGGAYIVYGGDNIASDFDVGALDGANGFALTTSIRSLQFGVEATELGDVNGDGIDDFSVSSLASHFIFYGSQSDSPAIVDVDTLTSDIGFVYADDFRNTRFEKVGDIDGDGFDDFILGLPFTGEDSVRDAGMARIVYGASNGLGSISSIEELDTLEGFSVRGTIADHAVGGSLGSAGDFNGDGHLDIAVGFISELISNRADPSAIQIIFGDGYRRSTDIELPAFNGADGILIEGIRNSFSHVTSAGDVNGDGLDDLLIGAFSTSELTVASSGAVYVVFGTADAATISVDDLDATSGYKISGASLDTFNLGADVSAAGDLNGDGYDDIIVGQRYQYESFLPRPGTSPQFGEAYVIYGAATGFHYDTVSGSGVFAGTANQELIMGSAGNDWIQTLGGSDLVDGQGGNDMVSFVWSDQRIGVLQSTNEIKVFAPEYAELTLRNVEGVTGTGADDLFYANEGKFRTMGGDDTIIVIDSGIASYDGGAGRDMLSYGHGSEGVQASLLKGRGWEGEAENDTYTDIEHLIGTLHDDFLWGDHMANRLEGGHGDDTLVGNGGDDYILAGLGTDVIVFSGNRADYTITQDGIRTDVVHNDGGWEGHDIIGHAEVLRFADGDLIL